MDPRAPSHRTSNSILASVFVFCLISLVRFTAMAQPPMEYGHFAGCKPLSERTGESGCWIVLTQNIGELPKGPLYWALDRFPTRAAAESAKSTQGMVVEALGEVWVFTLGAKDLHPQQGEHVTQIGPISVHPGERYTAQFMEAIMPPGVPTRTHRHPGPEAFYTESGESCLETPQSKQVGRKGVDIIIPEGEPMNLVTTSKEIRRSIILVLHPTSSPWITIADDWTPKGLCRP